MSWDLRPKKEQRIYIFQMSVLSFHEAHETKTNARWKKNRF